MYEYKNYRETEAYQEKLREALRRNITILRFFEGRNKRIREKSDLEKEVEATEP